MLGTNSAVGKRAAEDTRKVKAVGSNNLRMFSFCETSIKLRKCTVDVFYSLAYHRRVRRLQNPSIKGWCTGSIVN